LKPQIDKFRRPKLKDTAPVVKQLYRLSVEPRVVDRLVTLANKSGEPRSRIATRLFTEAVLAAKPAAVKTPKRSKV
jgi:hypothetical protein